MPATTQKAHHTTSALHTEAPSGADRTSAGARAEPAAVAEAACECDGCRAVVRDEAWTRWA